LAETQQQTRKAEFDPTSKLHVVTLQGRKYITYVGLQARLADQGKSIIATSTEIIRDPFDEENFPTRQAVVKVNMTIQKGDTVARLSCVADASSANVSGALKEATLRMAETRGQSRVLRIATRAPFTAYEELPSNNNTEDN